MFKKKYVEKSLKIMIVIVLSQQTLRMLGLYEFNSFLDQSICTFLVYIIVYTLFT